MKRGNKFALWATGLSGAGVCAGIIYLLFLLNQPPTGAPAEQERIVAAIRAFRERHGRLPDNLQEASIEFDRNLFDDVSYHKVLDPNEFEISCWKDYWGPAPTRHWWQYSSAGGTWEYLRESD